MQYSERDLGYIKSIADAFEMHLRNKRVNMINDNIKVNFHPLPANIANINEIITDLNMEFSKDNAILDNICSTGSSYEEYSKLIYSTTLEQNEPAAEKGIDEYPGSDIFGFFKSSVKDYCIKENHRNILFIITDGYMYMLGTNSMDSDNRSN